MNIISSVNAVKVTALSAMLAIGLVGCSGDYPDEGVLDTQLLTDEAKMVDVRGHVYGIKTGGIALADQASMDQLAVTRYDDSVWEAMKNDTAIPALELVYDASGLPDMSNYPEAVVAEFSPALDELMAGIQANIKEAEAKVAELKTKYNEVTKGGESYAAAVADEKAAYEKAQKELQSAIDAYNSALEKPVNEIKALAEQNGINMDRHLNPIRSYRSIDFNGKTVPASCPRQRAAYTTVDVRADLGKCMYIRMPSAYAPIKSSVVEIAGKAFLEFTEAEKALGEKGGWNSNGSGAYLARENAEDTYEKAVRDARKEYGDNRQRERQMNYLENRIAEAEATLAARKTDEYTQDQLSRANTPRLSDETEDMRDQYRDAVWNHAVKSIVKSVPLELNKESETVRFSGLESDLETIVIAGVFVMEKAGAREPVKAIVSVDLTKTGMKEADSITVDLDKYAFRAAYRIDMDDDEEVIGEITDQMLKVQENRTSAKAASANG